MELSRYLISVLQSKSALPSSAKRQGSSWGRHGKSLILLSVLKCLRRTRFVHSPASPFYTYRYMAPERFKNEDMTFFSDVYSFGILLWEICALKKPFGKGICFEALRTKVVDTNSRPCLKSFSSKLLKDLLTRCWDPNPSNRPTFESIDDILENLLVEVKAPIESGSNPGIRLSHSFSSRYESMIFDFSKADLSMNPNGSDSTDLNMSSRELRRSSVSTTR